MHYFYSFKDPLDGNYYLSNNTAFIFHIKIYPRGFARKWRSDETAYNTNDIQMYQKLLQTYAQAIKTRDLVGRAINNLPYDLEEKNVIESLTVTPIVPFVFSGTVTITE